MRAGFSGAGCGRQASDVTGCRFEPPTARERCRPRRMSRHFPAAPPATTPSPSPSVPPDATIAARMDPRGSLRGWIVEGAFDVVAGVDGAFFADAIVGVEPKGDPDV